MDKVRKAVHLHATTISVILVVEIMYATFY
jgi:hypothetical protein